MKFPNGYIEAEVLDFLEELSPEKFIVRNDATKAGRTLLAARERFIGLQQKLADMRTEFPELPESERASLLERIFGVLDERDKWKAKTEELTLAGTARGISPDGTNLIRLRKTVRGKKEREHLNRLLWAIVDELVESVWMLVEPFNKVKKVYHLQLFLRNGNKNGIVIFHPLSMFTHIELDNAPDYFDVDFRTTAPLNGRTPSRLE